MNAITKVDVRFDLSNLILSQLAEPIYVGTFSDLSSATLPNTQDRESKKLPNEIRYQTYRMLFKNEARSSSLVKKLSNQEIAEELSKVTGHQVDKSKIPSFKAHITMATKSVFDRDQNPTKLQRLPEYYMQLLPIVNWILNQTELTEPPSAKSPYYEASKQLIKELHLDQDRKLFD